MTYTAKVAVCSEIHTKNTEHKASTMYNFGMLNLVVRKEIARLSKVKCLLHTLQC
jgi:hypothetical protein